MKHPPPGSPAQSPALRAIQREEPPSLSGGKTGSLASVRSGRDLVADAENTPTIFVPRQLYAFLTSPEHTVTACLANATVDMPVRIIAEYLFGLGYGSFGLWTGENIEEPPAAKERGRVRGWLGRLNLGGTRSGSPKSKHKRHEQEKEDGKVSDESDAEDDQWRAMRPLSKAELAEVRRCGEWRGANPGDLFLNIYAQALLALEKNALNGLVSPPLMGQSGVIPLTIISHSLAIVRYYTDLIVRAKHEIFFTTNVWEASDSAKIVADSLRQLSKRVIERGGDKVVVKLSELKREVMLMRVYDRGVADGGAHRIVPSEVYSSAEVGLPSPEEIPGVSLEVQNYHIPPVGSFHQKAIVIDRNLALLSSNNVQNKDDVGMMVQLEGPIVQSVYDTMILSWWTSFNPRLPLLFHAPEYPDKLDTSSFKFGQEFWDAEGKPDLSTPSVVDDGGSVPPEPSPIPPSVVLHKPQSPFPIALVNRTPRGRRGKGDPFVPQNQAWLAGIKFATKSIFLQTPAFSAKPIVLAVLEAVRRGVLVEIYLDLGFHANGDISPDGRTNQEIAAYMYSQLEDTDNLRIYWYTPKGATSPLGSGGAAHTCHIKLMMIDGRIGIQGNGNVDVSSWYHAQEINVLIDSESVCTEWRAALDASQDTKLRGRVNNDGVWRDEHGTPLPAAPEEPPVALPHTPVPEPTVR